MKVKVLSQFRQAVETVSIIYDEIEDYTNNYRRNNLNIIKNKYLIYYHRDKMDQPKKSHPFPFSASGYSDLPSMMKQEDSIDTAGWWWFY